MLTEARRVWMGAMSLAVAGLVLVAVNTWFTLTNQAAQAALAQRQEFNLQTPQVQRAMQVVATALAEASARDNDEKLRTLLSNNGITMRINPPVPVTAP